MTHKPFNARAFERELVDAGYMPMSEYVRRWGEDKDEALSSRRWPNPIIEKRLRDRNIAIERAIATRSKANTGERADD